MTRRQRSILAVATLTQAVAIGVTLGVFPLLLEPLEASFAASRTQIASGPILIVLALSAAGIMAGGVLDKGEVRRAMLFGAGLLGTGLFLASVAPNLWVLGLAALVAGFSIPFIGPLAGMTLVRRLFHEEPGRAFGLMSMGPALGSGFFAGLAGFLLQGFDWRFVVRLLGAVTVLLLVPLIAWVIPRRVEAASDSPSAPTSEIVGLGDVLRRPVFWQSALVFALSAGIASGWTNHLAAFLGGVGLSGSQVTTLVAVQFWMGVPGAFLFGLLSDRVPLTALWVSMLLCQAMAFIAYASDISPQAAAIIGVVVGFMTGGMIPLFMMLLGARFEPQILGRAMGMSNLVMLPVMACTAILAASIYESRGSYDRAAMIFAAGVLLAIVSLMFSNRSAARR